MSEKVKIYLADDHKILRESLNSLLSRVRHTNTLVIADRGFPFWPTIETVDLTLIDNIPTVLNVLVEKFGLTPISTPEKDLAAILG